MQRKSSVGASMALAAVMLATGGAMADTIDSPVWPKPTPRRVPFRQITEADAERIAAARQQGEKK